MKKITTLICCIAIANIAFTQIKSNRVTSKAYEPTRQNMAIMAVTTNRDSVEINQLFEAFKIADRDATNKLEKLLEKIKAVKAKSGTAFTESELLGMSTLQQMMNERARVYEATFKIMQSMNATQKKIIENIGN
jgi:hypothetical protein